MPLIEQDCATTVQPPSQKRKKREHERVFEPYTRAHDRPGMAASVGLGLTVSRQPAELMEGTVDYSRESGLSIIRLKVPLAELGSSR